MCGDPGAEPSLVQANRLNPGEGAAETEAEALQQLVLNGIAGGGTARGDTNLAINRGQVVVDDAGTDDELFGRLGIGESLGHQAQYLDLAGCQSVRIGH